MKIEYALNLCDILWNVEGISQIDVLRKHAEKRLYIGSYFCQNYFLSLRAYNFGQLLEWCAKDQIHITVVVPIFSQRMLEEGKAFLQKLCEMETIVDEICVNDVGMLEYVSARFKQNVMLGRLFMKEQRDPRNPQLKSQENRQYRWNAALQEMGLQYHISGIEADGIYTEMDFSGVPEEYIVGVHEPYAYITTGRMCMYAGMHKQGAFRFMSDAPCRLECKNKRTCFSSENGFFVKIGKTVYYPSLPITYEANGQLRRIYWPCEEEGRGKEV